MKNASIRTYLGFAACLLLGACAETTKNYDAHFGEAARMTLASQVINPDAGKAISGDNTLDGQAAKESVDRYRASFKEPPKTQNAFTIGVSKTGQ